jgi:acyl-CoA synthetase (AMP-forming)/AMP-acid ligase II
VTCPGPSYARDSNAPDANAAAFRDGWFRTGDRGRVSDDGYVRLEGRIKELINRGGEKISPHEVEDALLTHPAVIEAVAFALPDEKYGEQVGIAVIARSQLAAGELAILRGPTGRVQGPQSHRSPR